MIFPTLEKRSEVLLTIREHKTFEELTHEQMNVIRGYYYSMETLERVRHELSPDEDDLVMDRLAGELHVEAIDAAMEALVIDAAEMYVSFMDSNAMESEDE